MGKELWIRRMPKMDIVYDEKPQENIYLPPVIHVMVIEKSELSHIENLKHRLTKAIELLERLERGERIFCVENNPMIGKIGDELSNFLAKVKNEIG